MSGAPSDGDCCCCRGLDIASRPPRRAPPRPRPPRVLWFLGMNAGFLKLSLMAGAGGVARSVVGSVRSFFVSSWSTSIASSGCFLFLDDGSTISVWPFFDSFCFRLCALFLTYTQTVSRRFDMSVPGFTFWRSSFCCCFSSSTSCWASAIYVSWQNVEGSGGRRDWSRCTWRLTCQSRATNLDFLLMRTMDCSIDSTDPSSYSMDCQTAMSRSGQSRFFAMACLKSDRQLCMLPRDL